MILGLSIQLLLFCYAVCTGNCFTFTGEVCVLCCIVEWAISFGYNVAQMFPFIFYRLSSCSIRSRVLNL